MDPCLLTSKACELFLEQPASEQRKLIALITQDATWQHGELRMTFREAFEQLRVSNRVTSSNQSPVGSGGAVSEIWRRKRDSNPRVSYPTNGFQDRRLRPLGHSSDSNLPSFSSTCKDTLSSQPPTRKHGPKRVLHFPEVTYDANIEDLFMVSNRRSRLRR